MGGTVVDRPLKADSEAILAAAVTVLPALETELLARIATRLVGGLRTYGELADRLYSDRVSWHRERQEEAWDWLVYYELDQMRAGR